MGVHRLGAVGHQRPDDGRRQAEMRHAVAFDECPQTIRARIVGRSFVEHERRAEQQRPGDRPRPHHPTQVGEPEQHVAAAQVEAVGEVLGALHRKAAVDVDGPLRSARGPGGVDQHVGRLGVGFGRRRGRGWGSGCWRVPPAIAARCPGHLDPIVQSAHDHHPADTRRGLDRRVGSFLEAYHVAAAQKPVGRNEDGRLAVGEAGRNGRCAVAREDRRVDRAELPEGENGDDGLHEHRQEDPDPVALAYALCRQHRGGRVDSVAKLRVREAAGLAVLGFPDQGKAGGVALGPGFERSLRVVERAADPPLRPFRAVGQVDDLSRPALPAELEVVRGHPPEPAHIVGGVPLQGLEVGFS